MGCELHVWGTNSEVSIISPECLASYWLVSLVKGDDIKVVSSSNTNLSKRGKLPVLITDEEETIEGYDDIVQYVEAHWDLETDFCKEEELSGTQKLVNKSLVHMIDSELRYLVQYNLYVNSNNYENYVRKLFKHYLPFPMMYNQPLKYYNIAKEQVKLIGIGENHRRFLSFGTDTEDVDEIGELETKPISKLHEKSLMLKNKERMSLRESKNTLRAMTLVDEFLTKYETLMGETKEQEQSEGHPVFKYGRFTSSELLLLAYISSLTHKDLPDKNLANVVSSHTALHQWFTRSSKLLEAQTQDTVIVSPSGKQVPNLFNEAQYRLQNIYSLVAPTPTPTS